MPYIPWTAPCLLVVLVEGGLVEGEAGQRVRVITLPDFGATRTIVLVNLRTLECSPVTFDGLPEGEQMQM